MRSSLGFGAIVTLCLAVSCGGSTTNGGTGGGAAGSGGTAGAAGSGGSGGAAGSQTGGTGGVSGNGGAGGCSEDLMCGPDGGQCCSEGSACGAGAATCTCAGGTWHCNGGTGGAAGAGGCVSNACGPDGTACCDEGVGCASAGPNGTSCSCSGGLWHCTSGSGGSGGAGGAPECDACVAGTTCCDDACANLDNDPFNCGGCGNVCQGEHPFCNYGHCDAPPCSMPPMPPGFCCGSTMCQDGQLCCEVNMGPSTLQCFTPTPAQPTCPIGCPMCN